MAERRAIKSKIWEDEFFGNLSPMAMLVWIGLFSRMADDQGRLLDNPNLISSQVFPYKGIPTDEIEACLNEIGDRLIRYEANGRRFIQIVRWWENQPMQYATPSNYPPPPGWVDKYRTNYKGRYIVFNWDGKDTPDTEIGTLLFNKLISLGRVSTWTDILGTLNPNPNPNPNPNQDKNKGKGNTGGEEPPATPPNFPDDEWVKDEPFEQIRLAFVNSGIQASTADDSKAITDMVKDGVIAADVLAGIAWKAAHNDGKPVSYVSQVTNPARVAMRQRLQKNNGHSKVPAKTGFQEVYE